MPTTSQIAENIAHIQQRIQSAATAANRSADEITLLAVSKTKPVEAIIAAIAAGQRSFGENYAQELSDKALLLETEQPDWHFIGPLQSNKTKLVANTASWVHSIDRLKIAQRLSEQRDPALPALQCCIQVNISQEAQKSGVFADQVATLARQLGDLPALELRGLMCIPSASDSTAFERMQQLYVDLQQQGFRLDTLSMGMSQDFEAAILHGSTHVRVGTAIFGARQPL